MEVKNLPVPLAPSLDKTERELILLKNGPQIRDIVESVAIKQLLVLIGKTHLQAGQKPDEQNINLTINDLYQDLCKYFGTFTFAEIEHSFKLGLMGEFGSYFGFNNKTYLSWTKGLLGAQIRLNANKKQAIFLAELNKPKELTQAQKDAIMFEATLKAFEQVRSGKVYHDPGNSVYNYVDRIKKIPFTAERKNKIMEKARENCLKKATLLIASSVPSNVKTIKAEIEDIRTGNKNNSLLNEAKNIAINEYFNDLLEVGEEIKYVLNG